MMWTLIITSVSASEIILTNPSISLLALALLLAKKGIFPQHYTAYGSCVRYLWRCVRQKFVYYVSFFTPWGWW